MKRTLLAAAIAATLASAGVLAQTPAPAAPKAAPKAAAPAASATPAAAAPTGKTLYTTQQFEFMVKERVQQGQQDSPELRNAVREELNTRELLAREARKQNLDKTADMKAQMDLASQTVLVRAYVADWIAKNPIPEADLRKEYDAIKGQIGDKEYKVRHVLVEKEDEAKEIVAELQKGAKFDELAKARSKDPGSKDRGGDLDWNAPGVFDKQFSDAMVKLDKGKYTEAPVQTRFGYHVIQLDDVRAVKVPPLAELKPRIQQQLAQQRVEDLVRGLRAKAKVE